MNKITLTIITLALVVGIGIIFTGGKDEAQSAQSVEIKDGVQYITIDAKGGYSPQITDAQAGIPSMLVVKTNGTYDCSASLAIPSLGFQKILAQTGEEVIDIGTHKIGEPLVGVCGMGMYNFQVNFN